MLLTRKKIKHIVKECEQMLRERFGVKAVYVFGSARGDAPWHEGSDLDLAVEGLKDDLWKAREALREVVPKDLEIDLWELEVLHPEVAAYARGERKIPKEPLAALKQQIEDELRIIEESVASAQRVMGRMPEPPDQDLVAAAGKYLDEFYSGIERIFERVCVWLEGKVPSGPEWHKQLLQHMQEEVKGVRPALLDKALAERLQEHLEFRHLFRYRYVPELEWHKMLPRIQEAPQIVQELREALQKFLSALRKGKTKRTGKRHRR